MYVFYFMRPEISILSGLSNGSPLVMDFLIGCMLWEALMFAFSPFYRCVGSIFISADSL